MKKTKQDWQNTADYYDKIIPECEDKKHKAFLKRVRKEIIQPKIL